MRASAESLQLAPHVHACVVGSNTIILDLREDRYFGLPPEVSNHLWRALGQPTDDDKSRPQAGSAMEETLRELLARGILERRTQRSTSVSRASICTPQRALLDGYVSLEAPVRTIDVLRFVAAWALTSVRMRFFSLERIAQALRRESRHAREVNLDLDTARSFVIVFRTLRPFFFRANNACLFDSLVLRDFLRRSGVPAHLVFGVATNPFSAHCWLQKDDVVINDTPEYVRERTQILVI